MLAILTSATAFARLGETEIQFADRYGSPKDSPAFDKNFPLLEGAIHHTYEYEGWKIRAAFVEPDRRAVRMELLENYQARRQRDNTGLRIAGDYEREHARGNDLETNCLQQSEFSEQRAEQIVRVIFWQRTRREDVATQRRSDSLVTQQNDCSPGVSRGPRTRSQIEGGEGRKSEKVGSAILTNVKC
jgi:hypothetical protein